MSKTAAQVIADAAVETAVLVAPVKKKARTKKDEAVKVKAEAKAQEPAPAPEPVIFEGFELKADANVSEVADAMKSAQEAADAIARKDSDLLNAYLTIGSVASRIAPMFKSTKVYGQALAALVPASSALDAGLRSNCKWLYEALNVATHESADLLKVLGVNRIEDYTTGNPHVIRREYNAKKKAAQIAAEKGLDADDADAIAEAMKADKDAAKAEKEAKEQAAMTALKSAITVYSNTAKKAETSLDDLLSDLHSIVLSAVGDGAAETASLLRQFAKKMKG